MPRDRSPAGAEDVTQELPPVPGGPPPEFARPSRLRRAAPGLVVAVAALAGFGGALLFTERPADDRAAAPASPPPATAAPAPPRTAAPAEDGFLREGDSGPEVAALQKRLLRVPDVYRDGTTDGRYDATLRDAVARFQLWYGIRGDETGVYGDDTRQALESRTGGPGVRTRRRPGTPGAPGPGQRSRPPPRGRGPAGAQGSAGQGRARPSGSAGSRTPVDRAVAGETPVRDREQARVPASGPPDGHVLARTGARQPPPPPPLTFPPARECPAHTHRPAVRPPASRPAARPGSRRCPRMGRRRVGEAGEAGVDALQGGARPGRRCRGGAGHPVRGGARSPRSTGPGSRPAACPGAGADMSLRRRAAAVVAGGRPAPISARRSAAR